MPREKKKQIVVVTPKTDAGKAKLEYHGEHWILREVVAEIKFARSKPGPFYGLISKDGKKYIFVKIKDDPDFDTRLLG